MAFKRIRQRGSVTAEYVVGLTFFVLVIMTPINDGNSAFEMLVNAIKEQHAAYMHATSLPL